MADLAPLPLVADVSGEAASPPVVLLHGLTNAASSYTKVIAHLAPRWRVHALDLRGHGRSPRAARYNVDDFAADVAAYVRDVVGGAAVVVGHSLGGITAVRLAQREPALVRALLVEDPPLFEGDDATRGTSPTASRFPAMLAQLQSLHGRSAGLPEFIEMAGASATPYGDLAKDRLGPDELEARGAALMRCDPATIAAAISGALFAGFEPTAPLAVPITVLRADPAFGTVLPEEHAQRFAAAVPQAVIVPISGVGHSIHSDRAGTDRYLAVLDEFLAAV